MKYKLEELVTIKYGKNQKKVKDENGIYPILGTGGRMGWANDFLYDKPSVLIPRKGSISRVMYIDEPFWTVDTLFYTIVKEKLVIPKYLYYNLSLIDFIHYNEGTTIPSLRTETLNKIEINIQPLNVQKQIVKILDCLENKININKKINTTLEEIAQAIFKHWFVDFEFPNENGEPYKSSGGKFVESELGMIPEGWKIKRVSELDLFIGDYVANGSFASLKKNVTILDEPSYALFIRNTDLKVNFSNTRKYVDEHSYNFLEKTKLFGGEVLISNVGDVGSVYLCPYFQFPMTLGNNMIMIKSNSNKKFNYYLYRLFKSHIGKFLINSITTGSVQLKFNKTDFRALKLVIPSKEVLERYINLEEQLEKKIYNIITENEKLKEIRDTLLPKLMSGEIRVPEAEEVVESCLQKNN